MQSGRKPSQANGKGFFLWYLLSKNRETLLLMSFSFLAIALLSVKWQTSITQGMMLFSFYLIPLALAGYAYYSYRRMKVQLLQTLEVLASITERTVDGKEGHNQRVAQLADWLALQKGMTEPERKKLRRAALYHDIGKLVLKGDELDQDAHALAGQRILERIPFLVDVSRWVGMHHLRYDGANCYFGLQGEKIELAARILHVADFVDTLLVQGKNKEEIKQILASEKGKLIDPELVDLIISGWWREE